MHEIDNALPMPEQQPEEPRFPLRSDPRAVKRPTVFLGLSPSDHDAVLRAARPHHFSKGEILHFKGERVRQVLLLVSGFVKITRSGDIGSEVTLGLLISGEILGAAGLLATGTHSTTALALDPCETLIWSAKTFMTIADHFTVLHRNMARMFSEDLSELQERFGEVATGKVEARLARQLLRMTTKLGRMAEEGIEVCLTRKELAEMLGTTLFTVSRLFSSWETSGIVKPSRGAVTICDLRSLRSLCNEV